jgi:hypothetical protein
MSQLYSYQLTSVVDDVRILHFRDSHAKRGWAYPTPLLSMLVATSCTRDHKLLVYVCCARLFERHVVFHRTMQVYGMQRSPTFTTAINITSKRFDTSTQPGVATSPLSHRGFGPRLPHNYRWVYMSCAIARIPKVSINPHHPCLTASFASISAPLAIKN